MKAVCLAGSLFLSLQAVLAGDSVAISPNVNLPSRVVAPSGKLTLFADYEARSDRGVPLYLVNRTNMSVELHEGVFGDTMLEHRLRGDIWERAQPLDIGWCGVGAPKERIVLLPQGQHFKWMGYTPAKGDAARVRYRLSRPREEFVSNEGDGLVSPEAFSGEQIMTVDNEQRMLLDFTTQKAGVTMNGKPVPPAVIVATARLLQVGGAYPPVKRLLADTATTWEKKANRSEDERRGAKALREILQRPWPRNRDPEALLARCIDALALSNKDAGEFGRPEEEQFPVWEALNGLRLSSMELQKWKPLMDFARKCDDPEIWSSVSIVFDHPGFVDEFLSDDFLKKHLGDSNPRMKMLCEEALARRKKGLIYEEKSEDK